MPSLQKYQFKLFDENPYYKGMNHHQILNVSPDSTADDISKAYWELADQYHPDKFTDDPVKRKEGELRMQKLNEAYTFLRKQADNKKFSVASNEDKSSEKQADNSEAHDVIAIDPKITKKVSRRASEEDEEFGEDSDMVGGMGGIEDIFDAIFGGQGLSGFNLGSRLKGGRDNAPGRRKAFKSKCVCLHNWKLQCSHFVHRQLDLTSKLITRYLF